MPDPVIQAIAHSPELRIEPLAGDTATAADPASGSNFGPALVDAIEGLAKLQDSADAQSQALALGKTTDIVGVTMAVERASLAMQLAVQVRNKAVDAYHEIFRMQV
jgi:flagellar hook-basal body complex protein FliE